MSQVCDSRREDKGNYWLDRPKWALQHLPQHKKDVTDAKIRVGPTLPFKVLRFSIQEVISVLKSVPAACAFPISCFAAPYASIPTGDMQHDEHCYGVRMWPFELPLSRRTCASPATCACVSTS
jgi:hypothetical protein